MPCSNSRPKPAADTTINTIKGSATGCGRGPEILIKSQNGRGLSLASVTGAEEHLCGGQSPTGSSLLRAFSDRATRSIVASGGGVVG